MITYQFFLSILPEYKKGYNIQYIDELNHLYDVYQKQQLHGSLQDDILKEPEFQHLENILLLNGLKFNHHFKIQKVNQETIDFLNQLYDYFPEYFKNIQDDNIYRFRHKLIHALPLFEKKNITTNLFVKLKDSFHYCLSYLGFLFIFVGVITFITFQSSLLLLENIELILTFFIFSTVFTFVCMWIFSFINIETSLKKHKTLKKSFPVELIHKIKYYQFIPVNIITYSLNINYDRQVIYLYAKINHLIQRNPNIKWNTFDIYNIKDLENAFEIMKSEIKQYV